jgi:hypothetical protein
VTPRPSRSRPHPSAGLIAGVVVATIGFLLPWFKQSDQAQWWYSGIEYLQDDDRGGWTLIAYVLLAVTLVAAIWAGGSDVAAVVALTAGVAAALFAGVVVAASLAVTDGEYITDVSGRAFSVGIPIMVVGFGVVIAAGVHAVAFQVVADLEDRIRRRTTS